jgi:transposase, IS30 family
LPKKTDLSLYTQEALDEIADSLNGRPRKTLQFLSPKEKIEQVLQ